MTPMSEELHLPHIGDTATNRSPRILIVRLSAIGDVIHGIPVLCALRAALPDAFLRESGLAGQRFAILNPGAGWPSKIWPADRYGLLAQHLYRAHGMPSIAMWGTHAEVPLAGTILAASNGHAVMAPPTSMLE